MRDYAFSAFITAHWSTFFPVYHLGIHLLCHSYWRGKLAPADDGRYSFPYAALIGLLLLAVGNGAVTVAEHQNVPSGIAAVVVATVPLFTLCFSRLFGIRTRKLEWLGIAIGLVGIIMLNSGGNLSGNPWAAVMIMIGSMSWAFGSVYGSRIELPSGMMAGAVWLDYCHQRLYVPDPQRLTGGCHQLRLR